MQRVKKEDIEVGDFIKTSHSIDMLIVCDLSKFNPVDHLFYRIKLLKNPMQALKPRHLVENFLLGPNRLMAMHPDGHYLFPRVKDIYYVIKNQPTVTNEQQ